MGNSIDTEWKSIREMEVFDTDDTQGQVWTYEPVDDNISESSDLCVAVPYVDNRKQRKKRNKKVNSLEYNSWNIDAYNDNVPDHGLAANSCNYRFTKDTWIADSGASCHMGPTDEGMFDVTAIDNPIMIGNGRSLRATKIGKMKKTVKQVDGKSLDIVLEEYKHVPSLQMHLFNVTKALDAGWKLGNDGIKITLKKGPHRVVFDRVMKTDCGRLCGVEVLSR
jgi:hypothetical protein